jgi:hypothetical protein
MTITIRPSRRGNFDKTGARLAELGVTYTGYDHHANCYAGVAIPPELEATLETDPLIEVERESAAKPRSPVRVWSSPESGIEPTEVGTRLRGLRTAAGLDLRSASALTGGKLSADKIGRIERTGNCDVKDLIALADLYGASLDKLTSRSVAKGDRRR